MKVLTLLWSMACTIATQGGCPEAIEEARVSHAPERIVWLAKHQNADGEWGPRPECACFSRTKREPVVKRDPEVGRRLEKLLADLTSENLVTRDQATSEIEALGRRAEPFLEDAVGSNNAEVSGRAKAILAELRRPENDEDVEATAMALLAFLASGYSHLSRDNHQGICFGTTFKNGLKWLIGRQRDDGAIGAVPRSGCGVSNAIAALVLIENYGMTGTSLLKEPAARASAWLQAQQRGSGAWGPGRDDPLTTFWVMLALVNAELSDVPFEEAVRGRGLTWQKARAEGGTAFDFAACAAMARLVGKTDISFTRSGWPGSIRGPAMARCSMPRRWRCTTRPRLRKPRGRARSMTHGAAACGTRPGTSPSRSAPKSRGATRRSS